jgi:hypothetical protein
MGEIVDFTARRLRIVKPPKTIIGLAGDAIVYLLADWEKMAKNNRLNDYFKSTVPNLRYTSEKTNFMADLNAISVLELSIDLFPIIFFPGTSTSKQLGWMVQFIIGNERIATPELASEAYARCFGILLYLKLKRDALTAGLIS